MSENIDVRPTFSLMEFMSLYTQGTLKVTEDTKSLSDRDSDDLLRIIFETGVVPTPFICVSRGREGWELVEGSRVFNALLSERFNPYWADIRSRGIVCNVVVLPSSDQGLSRFWGSGF